MAPTLAHDDIGAGDPIVFLHGITNDRSSWTPVAELLADRFRCVNVDLAGHGESPRTGAYDVFSQAGAVGEFLAEAGLERPLVVGHSYGAFVATLLGTMVPLRGVVNVDQELDTAGFASKIAPFETRLRGDDFERAFAEFWSTLRPDLVPAERRAAAAAHPDPDVVLGVWNAVFDTPPAELAAMIEPALTAFPVPYLAIFGTTISDEERRLLSLVPDVEIEVWDGLGHFVHLVEPERTAARIEEFAGRL